MHRQKPFQKLSADEYDFFQDGYGINVVSLVTSDPNIVWLTYKKAFTEITGLDVDGSSSLSEVPLEFFYFTAHAAYSDFLRMDGQNEKATLEQNMAKSFLNPEVQRAEQLMNANILQTRITTHVSRQSR